MSEQADVKIDDKDRRLYTDLAERLAAAWISYREGLSGVDYVLKNRVRNRIGDHWIYVAKQIDRTMTAAGIQMLSGAKP
jgi:hypothetical protein